MVKMVHPNGCAHNVRDDLVDKFLKAGWKQAAKPPVVPAEQKKKTRSKKQ